MEPEVPKSRKAGTGIYLSIFIITFSLAFYILTINYGAEDSARINSMLLPEESGNSMANPDTLPMLRVAVGAMISPQNTRRYYNELLKYIGSSLGYQVIIFQKKTYIEVNNLVENKSVDLAFVCSGPYVEGKKKFGMEIIAAPVVNEEQIYHSYIIVPEKSSAQSLSDLKGKKFAFTDPHSNTGFLVPKYMLSMMNETPESFFSETFYTYSHDNSIRAVAEGLSDGAAIDSLIWDFMNSIDPRFTSRTRILEKSPPYGIPPVVVHPTLDPALKHKLKEVFYSLHHDKSATQILSELHIDRFEPAEDSLYDSVRVMEEWVENQKK